MVKPEKNKSLERKVRNSYIISTVSIALVLFLLGSVSYLILNARKVTDGMRENITLYVMLKDNTGQESINAAGEKLHVFEEVRDVLFVSKKEAADDFKEYIGSDFEEFLQFNPLPDSYEIKLHSEFSNQETIKKLDKEISSWSEVDEVVYQKNILEDVTKNLNIFNLILLLFGVSLLVISLILLNNTIRLTIYSKRYLINTMKLVGATKWFIMKPFLGRSIIQGIAAWAIAVLMFAGLVAGLHRGLPEMTLLADMTPALIIGGIMLIGGILISSLFTIFAVNKFVNMNTTKIYLY